jgi:hypothetical protein
VPTGILHLLDRLDDTPAYVIDCKYDVLAWNHMAVALLGDFTAESPTTDALNSLKEILAWKCDQCDLDPDGRLLHEASQLILNTISGHRDGPKATECPGEALYLLLPAIRAEVITLIGQWDS